MKIRLTCTSCRASFLVTDEKLGQLVSCPKCGNEARMPESVAAINRESAARSASATARPSPAAVVEEPAPRKRRRLVPFLLGVAASLAVAGVAAVLLLPKAEPAPPPPPPDPIVEAATGYLDALVADDRPTIDRLGTIDDPPAIARYRDPRRVPEAEVSVRGSFAPIAELHGRLAEEYTYNEAIGRFENANPLGAAADFMDAADEMRSDIEAGGAHDFYAEYAGGTPDEQLDAAVNFAEQFAELTRAALPREKLAPTYAQLVEDADPPLPAEARSLADRVGEERDTWDALLGRPFHTIEADGPFVLEEAEVRSTVADRLASPGDPPRPLTLTLRRFRLEGIDTGWRVIAARRQEPEPETAPATTEPERSPGLEGPIGPEDAPTP